MFAAPVSAEYQLRQNKDYILRLVEEISFVDEAFFHNALEDTSIGNDLGVYFTKRRGEDETKDFFRHKATFICSEVYRKAKHEGRLDVYFYQRTLIRKYNEEGWATCTHNKKNDWVRVEVHSRFGRYSQSVIKWVGKGFQFLFQES